jgi:hypothetical protein
MAIGGYPGGAGITPALPPGTIGLGSQNPPMAGPVAPPVPASNPGTNVVVLQSAALRGMSLGALQQREAEERAAAEQRQDQGLITGLAGHIRWKFNVARDAKRFGGGDAYLSVEQRMIENMKARRSVYTPQKIAAIRQEGGSEVYIGLTGQKCRAAGAWIRDVMMTTGEDRPWSLDPTPVPELPPNVNDAIVAAAQGPIKDQIMAAAQGNGQPPDPAAVVKMMSMMYDQALSAVRDEARKRTDRMANKMEDQLIEGHFLDALDDFINDLTTFPTAIIKGPVIRIKPYMTWGPDGSPIVTQKLCKEWDRVDPFKVYPSPAATSPEDGDFIEKHRLSRADLQALRGVPGYDDGAIGMVLEDFGSRGMQLWLYDEADFEDAAGRPMTTLANNSDGLIDALQFWGSVQGQLLLDWGMKRQQIPDPTQEYQVEAWLIGSYVIKATLNPDPLNRRPYYATSYENVPGSFWGNSVADLVKDPQDICNAAGRAIVNNAAFSSGPQVGILVDRLAPGEQITQMRPWRIWQLNSDPMGQGNADPPVRFFQPQSTMPDLMAVFDKFAIMADDVSGIPRYMTGDARSGGAGRTASGLSMLMSNAGKMITAVIRNIDLNIMEPLLQRLYYFNMRYETDPELKGDVSIVARGASNLVSRENAQVRRTEFLATTANPIDMQIMGVEGRAAVLRETAKTLQMNTDDVVPDIDTLRQKLAVKAAMNVQAGTGPPGAPGPGAPPAGASPATGGMQGGSPPGPGATQGNQQTLTNGAPITDNMPA